MATSTHGMNVEEVQRLGADLQAKADEVRQVVSRINGLVQGVTWVGPDASRFKNEWWPGHQARLSAVAGDLHGFGQSALNNASAQLDASGGVSTGGVASGGAAGGLGVPGDSAAPGGGVASGGGDGFRPEGRGWQNVQKDYDAWATGRFAEGGVSHYQCTGWANFRWQELGYGQDIGGHGGAMASNAPGEVTGDPSMHAMASYRSGEYGHVMIVEEISADGNRIRVSEMNVGDSNYEVGRPQEFSDDRWITKSSDGNWYYSSGKRLEFAAFPG